MIKAIDKIFCTSCGLCVDLCQMDVIRFNQEGKVYIAYQGDCCHCLECYFNCPYEAIKMTPGVPKKFDINLRWRSITDALTKK